MRNDFTTNHTPKLLFIPRTIGNELLQSLRIYTSLLRELRRIEKFPLASEKRIG
jgi:hypothetical protein